MREAWKESKWFRFIVIWSVIYFITAILLYYIFFEAPFGLNLSWKVLSAREFIVWLSVWIIYIIGLFFGTVMLLREALKKP